MKRFLRLSCIAWLFWFSSCQDDSVRPAVPRTQQAFDVVGFLDQEIQHLSQAQASVSKTVSKEGTSAESKTIRQLNWAEELGSFADADLNKPALLGLFTEDKTTTTAGHRLHRYRLKEDAKAHVQEASYLFDTQGRLLQITATILQENMLFKTQKLLHLDIQPNALPRLQRYRLEERQELLWMDAERYKVEAEVIR